jgi:Lon protease-like protein
VSELDGLLALIDEFHITDRALVRAREQVRRGDGTSAVEALRRAAAKYFGDMATEAEGHVREIDRKLDDLYQRQYNLQAERSVAERRLSGARRVLACLEDAGEQAP